MSMAASGLATDESEDDRGGACAYRNDAKGEYESIFAKCPAPCQQDDVSNAGDGSQ